MKKKTKKKDAAGGKRRVFSDGLSKATQRSYDTKDSFGGGISYLKKDVKVNNWNCTDNEHLLDIIPYVAGPNDPNVKEGEPQYVLDIWVHRGVGALQQGYVCPQKNYKTRCPICEKQLQMRRSGEYSDEEISSLNPKRRTMYNVFCWDSKEEIRKGVQIWEVSHFFFEKHLAELSKRPKGGGFIIFSDPDNGKSISFKKKSKGSNMEFLGHRFEDRDEESEVTDEMLEAAVCLDELIHIPTVKELQKAVEEGFASEDDDDEKPSRKKGKKPVDDEDGDDDYDDEDETPRKKGKKPSKKVEEDDDDDDEDYDVDEDEDDDDDDDYDDDDDEEEEAPKKSKAKAKPKKKAVVDDDDEDDDDDDDEDDNYDDDDEVEEEEVKPVKKKKAAPVKTKKKTKK